MLNYLEIPMYATATTDQRRTLLLTFEELHRVIEVQQSLRTLRETSNPQLRQMLLDAKYRVRPSTWVTNDTGARVVHEEDGAAVLAVDIRMTADDARFELMNYPFKTTFLNIAELARMTFDPLTAKHVRMEADAKEHWERVLAFAKERGLEGHLRSRVAYAACPTFFGKPCTIRLSPDGDQSFYFVIRKAEDSQFLMNGGVIFHAGDGSNPPEWSVHT